MTDEEGRAGLNSPGVKLCRYEYGVTLLLMLAYTLNSADRTLIAIIGQPLKVDLKLSDTDFGLLVGTAFAALYAFSGVPIARLAERFSRVNILFVVMVLWSGLTALCATATSFAQLLLLRMGVGVAEAGCTPPAHSLIADYFAPPQRATAISIYSCGISLGYILSAMLGGSVAFHWGWRAACVVVGLPGVAVAVLVKLVIKEPVRSGNPPATLVHGDGAASIHDTSASNQDASISTPNASSNQPDTRRARSVLMLELDQLASVVRLLLLRWPIANFFVGVTVASFASQGAWAFIPAYFNRAFALDYGTVGLVAGLTGGAAIGFGLLGGGIAADYLGGRSAKWYAFVPAIGLAVSTPLYVLAFLQPDWHAAAVLLGIAGFFQYLSFGPTFGVVQNVIEAHQRATVTALIYVVLNVVALGGGPLFTGWLIDRFADFNFHGALGSTVAGSIGALGHSALASAASFNVACPGGQGASTATQVAQELCRSTLSLSSRQGIIVTVLLYAWAALHYALGAIGLEAELRASRLQHSAVGQPSRR